MCRCPRTRFSARWWFGFIWLGSLVILLFVSSAGANSIRFELFVDSMTFHGPDLFGFTGGRSSVIFQSSLVPKHSDLPFSSAQILILPPLYPINMPFFRKAPSSEQGVEILKRFLVNQHDCQIACTKLCDYTHGCTAFQARHP